MNFIFEWQKKKFIPSIRRVMFFLLYRQKDIDKIQKKFRQKVIVTAQIYSTAILDIVYNNLEK